MSILGNHMEYLDETLQQYVCGQDGVSHAKIPLSLSHFLSYFPLINFLTDIMRTLVSYRTEDLNEVLYQYV